MIRLLLVALTLLCIGCTVAEAKPPPCRGNRCRTPVATAAPTLTPAPSPAPIPGAEMDPEEQRALEVVNYLRASIGVGPLRWDDRLGRAAQDQDNAWAIEIGYYGHDIPKPWTDYIAAEGYPPCWLAQNAGATDTDPPGDVLQGEAIVNVWANSTTHYEGMLDPKYIAAGLGRAVVTHESQLIDGEPHWVYWALDMGSC